MKINTLAKINLYDADFERFRRRVWILDLYFLYFTNVINICRYCCILKIIEIRPLSLHIFMNVTILLIYEQRTGFYYLLYNQYSVGFIFISIILIEPEVILLLKWCTNTENVYVLKSKIYVHKYNSCSLFILIPIFYLKKNCI